MINAFLSYRHKNDNAITARNELQQLCNQTNKIKLVFDEDVTKEGDNLVVFMEDLVDARCVFLFLDPDYFQSGYTLFELISINEQDGINKRFIQAVRVTDDMCTYVRTEAKQFWLENEKIRNETARLLAKTGRLSEAEKGNHDAIWRRIDQAWSSLIEDFLDHLKYPAVENNMPTSILHGCVEKVVPIIQEATNSLHKDLLDHVKQQITVALSHKTIPLDELVKELDDVKGTVRAESESVASYITENGLLVVDILSIFTRVMKEQKTKLGFDSEEWEACFYDGEQIAGWLLLLSVDANWWFDNQRLMMAKSKDSTLDQIPLEAKEFVEIVISRSLMQRPMFRLKGDVVEVEPYSYKNDIVMVYDAKAKEEQFLRDIYQDLFGSSSKTELKADDLLDKVLRRAKSHRRNARGKAIYYLVSAKTKALLDGFEWYKGANERFEGCLHFICCEPPTKPYEKAASNEDQKDLLDQVALLLELNEE